jgi:ionotropic glutamate receptor
LGVNVDFVQVNLNGTDKMQILELICGRYANYLEEKDLHVIFDTTKTGLSSEIVKLLSASLAIPTVSASYGQNGDLHHWRNLNEQQKKFLLQVVPPIDVLSEVIRPIIDFMNITNAAILHDENFIFTHKSNSLLENSMTQHVITAIAPKINQTTQIKALRDLGLTNFFVLGSLESIRNVLGK